MFALADAMSKDEMKLSPIFRLIFHTLQGSENKECRACGLPIKLPVEDPVSMYHFAVLFFVKEVGIEGDRVEKNK